MRLESRTVPVVVVSYNHAFPWQILTMGAVLLLLAFAFRRTRRVSLLCLMAGTACVGGAALLWVRLFQDQV